MQAKNPHRRRRNIEERQTLVLRVEDQGFKSLSVSHLCPSIRRALVFFHLVSFRAETSAVFPFSSTPVSYRASNRVIEYFPHGQNV